MRAPLFRLWLYALPFEPAQDAYIPPGTDTSYYSEVYDQAISWVKTHSEKHVYIETVVPGVEYDEREEFEKLIEAFYLALDFRDEGNEGFGILPPKSLPYILSNIQDMKFIDWASPDQAKEIEDEVIATIEFLTRALFHNKTVFFSVAD